MPGLKTETFGAGDQRWLGSMHGVPNARSAILDITSLTEDDHYPNGYVPSGLPVAEVDGVLVPFVGSGEGANDLAGFVLTDNKINGDDTQNVALLDHGRVKPEFLPVPFDPADTDNPHFVWVGDQGGS